MALTFSSFKSVGVRRAFLFACLLFVSVATARGQEATTPVPPREQTPKAVPPAAPEAQTQAPGASRASTPVPAPGAPAQKPSTRPAQPAPASPRTPPAGPAQPPQAAPAQPAPPPPRVVTVVHRLSGWKLLTWLAASGPTLEIDRLPSTSDVLTNIVAGFVAPDNRTVVARLPRAEVELESAPAPQFAFDFFTQPATPEAKQQEFTLVTGDGRRVPAKFVGLDASTGLSMLEAAEPLVVGGQPFGDEGHTEDPSVGQLVRFYAPAPLEDKTGYSKAQPPQSGGYIYLSIDQTEGKLTEVRRAPSGRAFKVVARAERVTPAWTGAVATDGTGAVVGIVSQSGTGESQIVPVEAMKLAMERVRATGASVPQPWLGARGDAAYRSAIEQWTQKGWKPEMAMPFIRNGQGVLLTSVAPGTPAATAGLRPGDVISRVGEREVSGIEDLSFFIKEAGVGKTVDFTVWRAFETAPLKFEVMLKGRQNPALATADRELFAARSRLYALNSEVQNFKLEAQRLRNDPRPPDGATLSELYARLRATEESIASVLSQVAEAEQRIAEASAFGNGPLAFAGATPRPGAVPSPLQTVGLRTVGLTARGAMRLGAKGGVLVVGVRPESPAAASGLRAGDVVETVDGQSLSRLGLRRRLLDSGATSITLGIVRERKRQSVTLSLALDTTP